MFFSLWGILSGFLPQISSLQGGIYVKLRIGILQGISFLCGNRGLIINCKN